VRLEEVTGCVARYTRDRADAARREKEHLDELTRLIREGDQPFADRRRQNAGRPRKEARSSPT